MKEYVLLPPAVHDNGELMGKWLNISYDYVSSLPIKEKKQKKKKT